MLSELPKWMFWLGVVLFVVNLPNMSVTEAPVGAVLPLIFTVPYIAQQVQQGAKTS